MFVRGSVYWGENSSASGGQQKFRRPYLVISNDKCNTYSNVVTAIPLTTKGKANLPTHCSFRLHGVLNTALCEQVTSISKSDLEDIPYATLSEKNMKKIENCLRVQVGLGGTNEQNTTGKITD